MKKSYAKTNGLLEVEEKHIELHICTSNSFKMARKCCGNKSIAKRIQII